MPWYYRDRSVRHRYSQDGHIDLCDWLADHGAARSSSLDALARLIGLPGKVGVDGSQIEGMPGRVSPAHPGVLPVGRGSTALLFLPSACPGRPRPDALPERGHRPDEALAGDARLADLLRGSTLSGCWSTSSDALLYKRFRGEPARMTQRFFARSSAAVARALLGRRWCAASGPASSSRPRPGGPDDGASHAHFRQDRAQRGHVRAGGWPTSISRHVRHVQHRHRSCRPCRAVLVRALEPARGVGGGGGGARPQQSSPARSASRRHSGWTGSLRRPLRRRRWRARRPRASPADRASGSTTPATGPRPRSASGSTATPPSRALA